MKCPECKKEIDHLTFDEPVNEFGRYDGKSYEVRDKYYSEGSGIKFFCPECEVFITDSDSHATELLIGKSK